MICPYCGAPTRQRANKDTSQSTRALIEIQATLCLCRDNEEALVQKLGRLEAVLENELRKKFPRKSLEDIKQEMAQMPRDDLWRCRASKMMAFSGRLRAAIQARRTQSRTAETQRRPGNIDEWLIGG